MHIGQKNGGVRQPRAGSRRRQPVGQRYNKRWAALALLTFADPSA